MAYQIGLIGGGNMGSAMLNGIIQGGVCPASDIIVAEKREQPRTALSDRFGIHVTPSAQDAAAAQIVILAVKPAQLTDALAEIRDQIGPDQIVVSIVAGQSIQTIEDGLVSIKTVGKLKVVRVMPNTPALTGSGMSALSPNAALTPEDTDRILAIFNSFGRAALIPESQMDIVTGLSGSSPAFIYMLIEAMADAAVAQGFPRDLSYEFAAQTVMGSARMVLETGEHPGRLKDAVCSPGGTTIAGVLALEETGFRASIAAGITAAIERSRELG